MVHTMHHWEEALHNKSAIPCALLCTCITWYTSKVGCNVRYAMQVVGCITCGDLDRNSGNAAYCLQKLALICRGLGQSHHTYTCIVSIRSTGLRSSCKVLPEPRLTWWLNASWKYASTDAVVAGGLIQLSRAGAPSTWTHQFEAKQWVFVSATVVIKHVMQVNLLQGNMLLTSASVQEHIQMGVVPKALAYDAKGPCLWCNRFLHGVVL